MKEQCIVWEEGKEKGTLTISCPLQQVCGGEICLTPVSPMERKHRRGVIYERQRHYSDVPDHRERSLANHK